MKVCEWTTSGALVSPAPSQTSQSGVEAEAVLRIVWIAEVTSVCASLVPTSAPAGSVSETPPSLNAAKFGVTPEGTLTRPVLELIVNVVVCAPARADKRNTAKTPRRQGRRSFRESCVAIDFINL